jgi:hypothetical protein
MAIVAYFETQQIAKNEKWKLKKTKAEDAR